MLVKTISYLCVISLGNSIPAGANFKGCRFSNAFKSNFSPGAPGAPSGGACSPILEELSFSKHFVASITGIYSSMTSKGRGEYGVFANLNL